jgi:nucleoside-diphosphate-sugar epimerase
VQDQNWGGQQIVHIGSALEYGTTDGDLSEDSLPTPTTAYGQTKLAGTQVLSEYNARIQLKGMTARLFTVYGPGEHAGRLLPSLINMATNGQSLELTAGLQERDFIYVGDVAEGLLRIGSTASTNISIVNLATGHLLAVRGFIEIVADSLSIPAGKLNFGVIPTREEEMQHAPVAVSRLKQLTDWLPQTEVRQGIHKTMDFLKSH